MLEQRLQQHFIDSADLNYQAGPPLSKALVQATHALLVCVTSGCKVLACGSGVSNLLAAQFAAMFVGRFERERPELSALALTASSTDPLADTAQSAEPDNFARQVRALGQAGDVLLVLCASGKSASLLAAVQAAHSRDMTVIALLGQAHGGYEHHSQRLGSTAPTPASPAVTSTATNTGPLGRTLRETDVQACVPHDRAARIHEVHLLMLHGLCDGVDGLLLGEGQGVFQP